MDLHHHHHPPPQSNTTTTNNPNPNRAEAERLLGIAEKLLQTRDLTGSREFALLAQETEPLLEGSDQILAITDVLLASEKRVVNNRHHDWYSILQNSAFKLVADAWALLSDQSRRGLYYHELNVYSKVELRHQPQSGSDKDKLPVRRIPRGGADRGLDSSQTPVSQRTFPASSSQPRASNIGAGRRFGMGSKLANF